MSAQAGRIGVKTGWAVGAHPRLPALIPENALTIRSPVGDKSSRNRQGRTLARFSGVIWRKPAILLIAHEFQQNQSKRHCRDVFAN